jgi:hypothetical protein
MIRPEFEAGLQAIGIKTLAPEQAVRNLSWILECSTPNAIVVDADWDKLREVFAMHRKGELFDRLVCADEVHVFKPNLPILSKIRSAPDAARAAVLRAYLAEQIGFVMNLAPEAGVPTDQPLFALGLDSLMALEVNKRVASDLGCFIDATFVLDHPTIDAMSEHLLANVLNLQHAQSMPVLSTVPYSAPTIREDIDPLIAAELQRLDQLLGSRS